MIKIEINDDTFSIPEKWEEVNLKLFVNVMELETKRKEFRSDTMFNLKLISILGSYDENILMEMEPKDFNQIIESIGWINSEPKSPEGTNKITIDEIDYMFPDTNNKSTMGEVISLEILLENNQYDIVKMAAIFLRPEGEKFDSDKMPERELLFGEKVFITDVIGYNNSFLNGEKESSDLSQDTLEKEVE